MILCAMQKVERERESWHWGFLAQTSPDSESGKVFVDVEEGPLLRSFMFLEYLYSAAAIILLDPTDTTLYPLHHNVTSFVGLKEFH